MARWTFAFSNGVYNDWHRKYDGIAMIDIDSIECCPRCYEPLAILETGFDKNQKYKATTLSKIVPQTKHTQPVSYTHLTLPTNREV